MKEMLPRKSESYEHIGNPEHPRIAPIDHRSIETELFQSLYSCIDKECLPANLILQ